MIRPALMVPLAASLLAAGCAGAPEEEWPGAGPVTFTDRTIERGLDPERFVPVPDLCGSVAVLDQDGDQRDDLLVMYGGGIPLLYRNTPQGFIDVTDEVGLGGVDAVADCATVADFDDNGEPDLLLFAPESQEVRLFASVGDRFENRTATSLSVRRAAYRAATAGDVDGDGDLDVVATRWSAGAETTRRSDCRPAVLFENVRGVLTERPDAFPSGGGCSLVALLTDVDDDGDLDVYEGNDYGPMVSPNRVLLNGGLRDDGGPAGPVTWSEASSTGLEVGLFAMGIAVGDVDGDGVRDYFVTSMGPDALLRGLGDGRYEDVTRDWRVDSTFGIWGRRYKWSTRLADLDNDGDQDLLVVAGDLPFLAAQGLGRPAPTGHGQPLDELRERVSVFVNHGPGQPMEDISGRLGPTAISNGRSLAVLDSDLDGDLDFAVGSADGLALWSNETATPGRWAAVRLEGTVSNHDAVGARVWFRCDGEPPKLREQVASGGVGGSATPVLHAGFGGCNGPVTVDVAWPSGLRQDGVEVVLGAVTPLREPEWLTVGPVAGPAGAREVPVGVSLPSAGDVLVRSSAGTEVPVVGGAARIPVPDGAGELVLSVIAGGVELGAHPRVQYGEPPVDFAIWPMPPTAGSPVAIGAVVRGAQGPIEVAAAGIAEVDAQAGAERGWVLVEPGLQTSAIQVEVRAGGALVASRKVEVRPFFQPERSRVELWPPFAEQWPAEVAVTLVLRDEAGAASRLPAGVEPVLLVDGEAVETSWDTEEGRWRARVQVTGPTHLEIQVAGASAGVQDFDLAPTAPVMTLVDAEASQLAFVHRYGVAGELAPVAVQLLDARANCLHVGELLPHLRCDEGCTLVPGSEQAPDFPDCRDPTVVRARLHPEASRAVITLAGGPTALRAELAIVPPYTWDPAALRADLLLVGEPAVGEEAVVEVFPRDPTGALVGPSPAITLEEPAWGTLTYAGDGRYLVTLPGPAAPCTATVRIGGVDLQVGDTEIHWGGGGPACSLNS